MPSTPDRPSEPSDLHRAFSVNHPLDWGDNPLSAADIVRSHGAKATNKSLRLLEQAAVVEPRITTEFLASLPATASPYQLARRVKSPQSLARKIRTSASKRRRIPLDDVLRYTVLTTSPNDLVEAARQAVDKLTADGWRVAYAMHSYTDGSRYKGIHAYLSAPGINRVEVQFHSRPSVKVKELTTPWYEIERSADAPAEARATARQQCVDLSATLSEPPGINGLTELGGRQVAVNNYSDSLEQTSPQRPLPKAIPQATEHTATLNRHDGMMR